MAVDGIIASAVASVLPSADDVKPSVPEEAKRCAVLLGAANETFFLVLRQ